jgi:hypothetical protein
MVAQRKAEIRDFSAVDNYRTALFFLVAKTGSGLRLWILDLRFWSLLNN